MNKRLRRITADIDLRVSLLYTLVGGLWILLSDRLLELFITDISQLSKIQTYKGWMYVALSALLIYALLRRELRRHGQAQAESLSLAKFPAENPNPILRISSEGVILYANRNSQPLLELWMCEVGSRLPDPIPEIVSACLQNNTSREMDIDCNGRIFSMIFAPIMETDYVNGYGRDITDRIRAEKKVIQMKRLYATLSQVNQMIVRVKERDELFQTICDVAVQFGEIPLAWIGLIDETSGDVQPIASKGLDIAQLPLPHNNVHRQEFRDSPIATAFRTSKVTTSDDILMDSRTSGSSAGLQAFPYRAAAIIPFRLRNKSVGVLTLLSSEKGMFRDEDEIRLLDEMGLDISFALDNMENEKERKAAEETLRRSEERFRLLFENNHSVMLMMDPISGSIRDANAAAAKFYGYSVPELRSMKIDQINQLSAEEVHAERMQALKEERNYFQFRHRLCSGAIRSVEVYSAPFEVEGNTVLFSIIHDITESKRVEQENAWLASFPARNPNPIVEIDSGGAVFYMNPAAKHLFPELHSQGFNHPWLAGLEFAISRFESEGIDKFQREVQVGDTWYIQPLTYIVEAARLRVYGSDITEIKRAEEQIQRQLKRLNALRMIDSAINSTVDLRVVLNIVLQYILSQLGVDAGAVLLLKQHLQSTEYVANRGFQSAPVQPFALKSSASYASRVVAERRTVHIKDFLKMGERNAQSPQMAQEGFIDYFGTPLLVKGDVKGVLEIYHRSRLDLSSEQLEFFETLAGQAAIAIDNSQLFSDMQRAHTELIVAYDATITGWSRALALRGQESEGHAQRVTDMTITLARAMGMPDGQLVHIRHGALLHDIGKMAVPDSILQKLDPLTEDEAQRMQKHPEYAYEMLSPIGHLQPALDIPYCHHEKWDGTGYPRGLKGDEIPIAARIFAVVDAWDNISRDQANQKAFAQTQAREYIQQQAGKHFDPHAVEVFLRLLSYHDR